MGKYKTKLVLLISLILMGYLVHKLIGTPKACSEPAEGGSCEYSK